VSESIAVFVNEKAVRVAPDSSVADAVAIFDAALAQALAAGGAQATDGRGIALDPHAPVYSGAILRVFLSARRGRDESDAHA
jgi:hypothetical protein